MDTRLIKKETVAEGTVRFYLERPQGFEYRAGQSIDLTLVHPPETDAEGNTRAYSLVSIPSEDELSITTRLRDTAFKRVLQNLEAETPLTLEGPFGSFTLHENPARAAIFLAGGIGVTPFYSMIRDAVLQNLAQQIYLFYSNRRPEDAAFLEEFQQISASHEAFTFVPTMTLMAESQQSWTGETGYITAEMIQKHTENASNPIYYLAGPAAMVAAMRAVLNNMDVSNDDIRTEEFTGY